MSDFFIWLEEEGIIESTEWAFENLSDEERNALVDNYMWRYLSDTVDIFI